jgi:Fic family protein
LPGQWRPGPIFVVHEASKDTVYEGPEANLVPGLIQELVDQVVDMRPKYDATVVAAMAHLNLAMIHPFRVGTGRMARALHTLMLTRVGVVSPEFCSIEEWLGRNTDAYYAILAKTGQGQWHPENDALEWVRFCLVAHYQQAATIRKRSIQVGKVWGAIEQITTPLGLNERTQTSLMDAAFGYTVKNLRYRTENAISEVVASRDLRHLCDLGLLEPVGEKRGRHYIAAGPIKELSAKHADRSKIPNPYDLVAAASLAVSKSALGQLSLGLE